ncbi:MAG TPA: response regulator [Accumulibacter sp.]|uniref:HD domain-containing phosphohydrolase n=2 Tax=Accumulibacter sp. TaxID=2053492 RepID=UPI002C8D6527|nr:HD domain-containing phosphohydrolase [Accumulibacter sp.]HMV06138.1 response regulator [Accumulibacter sp.]HNC26575.1 response regulator [Accumulibacter sp.]HNG87964.1 response regulator [Accumulibacter sp.]
MNESLRRQARILLIDDEPANLKLLAKMLASQHYEHLVTLQDSRQVIGAYHANRPDLILLDINMPHLDGYQVMAQLQALNDPLLPPIVILTAQHGRETLLKALAAGARDFIGKPFDMAELLMRVSNLLDAHLAHRMLHDQKGLLEEMVRQRTDELNQTRLQVVRRLGRAAEYRDNETGYHILRMSKYSALLAQHLGWGEAACDLMLNASPMHDIGKIGIPDAVLLKPGRLDENEMAVIRTHPEIGASLLAGDNSELLRMAQTIARTHHEKWDGSGYPAGLAGPGIPQAGRIVAVADVFDALSSSRPYKRAWKVEDAVAHVIDKSGSHFDPNVVRCFQEHLPEILAIGNEHREPHV